MPAHDSTNYSTTFACRGNPTTVSTPTNTVTMAYDIGGNTTSSNNNGVTTSSTTSSTNNFAVPAQLTTNALSTSLSYTSFLGVTQATGPNGATASVIYDPSARPSTTISPSGAVTTYTYAPSGQPIGTATNTATTNGHWVKTQLDGFGRTMHAITGYGTGTGTTVSTVDTVYAPCGGSR
jgi:YD repeat-containing protein